MTKKKSVQRPGRHRLSRQGQSHGETLIALWDGTQEPPKVYGEAPVHLSEPGSWNEIEYTRTKFLWQAPPAVLENTLAYIDRVYAPDGDKYAYGKMRDLYAFCYGRICQLTAKVTYAQNACRLLDSPFLSDLIPDSDRKVLLFVCRAYQYVERSRLRFPSFVPLVKACSSQDAQTAQESRLALAVWSLVKLELSGGDSARLRENTTRALRQITENRWEPTATTRNGAVESALELFQMGNCRAALQLLDPHVTAHIPPATGPVDSKVGSRGLEECRQSLQMLNRRESVGKRTAVAFRNWLIDMGMLEARQLGVAEQVRWVALLGDFAALCRRIASSHPRASDDLNSLALNASSLVWHTFGDLISLHPDVSEAIAQHYWTEWNSSGGTSHLRNAAAYADHSFKMTPRRHSSRLRRAMLAIKVFSRAMPDLAVWVDLADAVRMAEGGLPESSKPRGDVAVNIGLVAYYTSLLAPSLEAWSLDGAVTWLEESVQQSRLDMSNCQRDCRQTGKSICRITGPGRLTSAAMARLLRFDKEGPSSRDPKDLLNARDLCAEAVATSGGLDFADSICYAKVLFTIAEANSDAELRSTAVTVQTEALQLAREQSARNSKVSRKLNNVTWVIPSDGERAMRLVLWAWLADITDGGSSSAARLANARHAARYCLDSGDLVRAVAFVDAGLSVAERSIGDTLNQYLLLQMQGLAAIGAEARNLQGNVSDAMAILERGVAVRARNLLKSIRSVESISQFYGAKRAVADSAIRPSAAASSARPEYISRNVLYLVAGEDSGLALLSSLQRKDCGSRIPSLTSVKVEGWRQKIYGMRAGVRRAADSASSQGPSRSAVTLVLQEMADCLAVCLRGMEIDKWGSVALIPIGHLTSLPWASAIALIDPTLECTASPSSTLLSLAASRSAVYGTPLALTNPDRLMRRGRSSFSALPFADWEGRWLQVHVGADHLSGGMATKEQFARALSQGRRFLHLGVHGVFDSARLDSGALVWSPSNGIAQTTTLEEIATFSGASCGLVFLAACWGAATSSFLPEEANGFPLSFMLAGVSTVIAPLWPVDDDVSAELAKRFYRAWVFDGLSSSEALSRAKREVAGLLSFEASSTYAAFCHFGVPLNYSRSSQLAE